MRCTIREHLVAGRLVGVEEEEGNHEGEQAGGFGEGKTKDGIREELASESRVASDAIDERAEDSANADTSARETDRGSACAVHLGSCDERSGRGLDDDAPGLHRTADHGGRERVPAAIEEQAVTASRLASSGDDGAGNASLSLCRRHQTIGLLEAHTGDGADRPA